MDYRGGGPHSRGPPHHRPRGIQNYQSHHPPRMMNPYNNNFPANNFQGQEDGLHFQNQSHAPVPQPQPMDYQPHYSHPPGFLGQNLPSPNDIPAGYPGFQQPWGIPTAPVYLDMSQVAPMPFMATATPSGIVAGQKYNNIDMASTCSKCKQKSPFWQSEITIRDDTIKKLTDQQRAYESRIRELEELVVQNQADENEDVCRATESHETIAHEVVKSQLSPDATAFTPSVPVVSAKGIAEELDAANQDTNAESEFAEEIPAKLEPLSRTDSPMDQCSTSVSTFDVVTQSDEKNEFKSWADVCELDTQQETITTADNIKLSVESQENPAYVEPTDNANLPHYTATTEFSEDKLKKLLLVGDHNMPHGEIHGQSFQGDPMPADSQQLRNPDWTTQHKTRRIHHRDGGNQKMFLGFGRGKSPAMEQGLHQQNKVFDDKRGSQNPNMLSNHDGYQERKNSGPREFPRKEYKDNKPKDSNNEVQIRRNDEIKNESSNNVSNATADGKEPNENWRTQHRKNPQHQNQGWANDQTDKVSTRKNNRVNTSDEQSTDQHARGPYFEKPNRPYHDPQNRANHFDPGMNHQGNFNQPNYNMQHTGHHVRGSNYQNRGMQHNQQGQGYHQGNKRFHHTQTRPPRNKGPEEGRQSGSSFEPNASGERGSNKMFVKDVVVELQGDLFSAPIDYSLAHCVAKDFRMGSGIAVKFRNQFKQVPELLDQNVDVGGCAYIKDPGNDRFIFYLVTKSVSNGKPSIEDLQSSLESLLDKCKELGVTKLALPRIGCGLDCLQWVDVKYRINEVFKNADIGISVYEFNVPPNYYKGKSIRWRNYNSGKFQSRGSNDFNSYTTIELPQDFDSLAEGYKSQEELNWLEHYNSILLDKSSGKIDTKKGESTMSSKLGVLYERSHTQGGSRVNQDTKVLTEQSYSKSTSIQHNEALMNEQHRKTIKQDRANKPSRKPKQDNENSDSDSVFNQKKQTQKKRKNKSRKKDIDRQELEGKSPETHLNSMDAIKVNYGSSDDNLASNIENKKMEKVKSKIKRGSMKKRVNKTNNRNEELKVHLTSEDEHGSSYEEKNTKVEYEIKSRHLKKKRRKADKKNKAVTEPLTSEDEHGPSYEEKNTKVEYEIKSSHLKKKRRKADKKNKAVTEPLTSKGENDPSNESSTSCGAENTKVKHKIKSKYGKIKRSKTDKGEKELKVTREDEGRSSDEIVYKKVQNVKDKIKSGSLNRRTTSDKRKTKVPLVTKHESIVTSSKYKYIADNTTFKRVHEKIKSTSRLKRARHDMDSSEDSEYQCKRNKNACKHTTSTSH